MLWLSVNIVCKGGYYPLHYSRGLTSATGAAAVSNNYKIKLPNLIRLKGKLRWQFEAFLCPTRMFALIGQV